MCFVHATNIHLNLLAV